MAATATAPVGAGSLPASYTVTYLQERNAPVNYTGPVDCFDTWT
jgi:hypothetical protein